MIAPIPDSQQAYTILQCSRLAINTNRKPTQTTNWVKGYVTPLCCTSWNTSSIFPLASGRRWINPNDVQLYYTFHVVYYDLTSYTPPPKQLKMDKMKFLRFTLLFFMRRNRMIKEGSSTATAVIIIMTTNRTDFITVTDAILGLLKREEQITL